MLTALVSAAPSALLIALPLARAPQEARCPDWRGERLARLETRLAEQVDRRRRRLGRAPLSRDPRLDAVARGHAREMAERRSFGHRGADGSTVFDRLRSAGVEDWSSSAENLGRASSAKYRARHDDGQYPSAGCHDPESLGVEIEAGWAVSPGHREALLSAAYSHLGSGAAWDPRDERVYVVQVFVARIRCGFSGGPCCEVPLRPAERTCQTPLACEDDVCR